MSHNLPLCKLHIAPNKDTHSVPNSCASGHCIVITVNKLICLRTYTPKHRAQHLLIRNTAPRHITKTPHNRRLSPSKFINENPAVYRIKKNVMWIRNGRSAFCMFDNWGDTHKHSEYVIHIVYPCQHWLGDLNALLHCTYIVSSVPCYIRLLCTSTVCSVYRVPNVVLCCSVLILPTFVVTAVRVGMRHTSVHVHCGSSISTRALRAHNVYTCTEGSESVHVCWGLSTSTRALRVQYQYTCTEGSVSVHVRWGLSISTRGLRAQNEYTCTEGSESVHVHWRISICTRALRAQYQYTCTEDSDSLHVHWGISISTRALRVQYQYTCSEGSVSVHVRQQLPQTRKLENAFSGIIMNYFV